MVGSRLGVLVAVVLAALAVVGCMRRRGAATIGVREERRLIQQAAAELGCPGDSLTLTPLHERVYQVHGCGQLRDYALVPGRRGGWRAVHPVVLRAAAELGCPAPQLRVDAPAASVRSVAGCGRSARYDLVCGAIECAWMMTAQGAGWGAPGLAGGSVGAPDAVPPPPGAVAASTAPAATVPARAPASAEDELAIPEPPARGSPEELLRATLDARRAEIHRCAGAGVVPVRASWTDEGAVTLALEAPLAGGAAESCVRSAVVMPQVPAGSAGEIVHPVL